jgi:hypothetical protein
MITDIQTVRFYRTEKDANNNDCTPEYGLLICVNGDTVRIIDDKGFHVKRTEMYSYTETNDIGLHNLKIGK